MAGRAKYLWGVPMSGLGSIATLCRYPADFRLPLNSVSLPRPAAPSDQFRKELMVSRLLDLIEMRRAEYAEERPARSF